MMRCVKTLTTAERPLFCDHLLRLDAEDRRLRFGSPLDDHGIRRYVRQIDLDTGRILALLDDDSQVVAAVHIAPSKDGAVELAFSVDRAWRGRGLGDQLLDRAILWARNRGLRRAYVYYLSDNHAIRHMVRRANMAIQSEAGESEASLALLPATPFTLIRELVAERYAMYDSSLKANWRARHQLTVKPAV
jgi:GNAT superfamily N-acetyltransferase